MPFDLSYLTRRQILTGLCSTAAISALPRQLAAKKQQTSGPLLNRGISIPLWMDMPEGAMRPPSPHTLAMLRALGFETIRLPVDPDRFAESKQSALKASRQLDAAISSLRGHGFTVTIDNHPLHSIGKSLEKRPEVEESLIRALARMAKVAAGYSTEEVYIELLNEPPIWRNRWLPLRTRLQAAARRHCPDHLIISGANRFQTVSETLSCPPLADHNALTAIHYYHPLEFTHQCKSWGTGPRVDLSQLPFPADLRAAELKTLLQGLNSHQTRQIKQLLKEDWTEQRINADFKRLADWAATNRQRVIINEFGALKTCTDSASRARWTAAVRRAAERHNIGWTYWEFDRGFGFFQNRTTIGEVDERVLAALVGI